MTTNRRIDYAGSVHDEREIEAVVEVLRGGPTALRIGKNVKAMERRVAERTYGDLVAVVDSVVHELD